MMFLVSDICSHSTPCKHSVRFILKNGNQVFIESLDASQIRQLYTHFNIEIPAHFDDTIDIYDRCCTFLTSSTKVEHYYIFHQS